MFSYVDFEDLMISNISFKSKEPSGDKDDILKDLDPTTLQNVINLIQTKVGEPYDKEVIESDIRILTPTGLFDTIGCEKELQDDGTLHLTFTFLKLQIIKEVSVVGNYGISDDELLAAVPVIVGLGKDDDTIDGGRRAIIELYKRRGYYLVEVSPEIIVYPDSINEETGFKDSESLVLIYKVIEGPRVRLKGMSFFGNHSFSDKELASEIETSVSIPFIRRGELDEEKLEADAARLESFYHNRGFIDADVAFENPLSPDDKEAAVVFLIEEGKQFTVGSISTTIYSPPSLEPVFSEDQIRALVPIKTGDVFRQSALDKSVATINQAYGVIGRVRDISPIEETVKRSRNKFYTGESSMEQDIALARYYRAGSGATMNIEFSIMEGLPTKVGQVIIKKNIVTKDRVIRGRIGLKPGYPFDVSEGDRSEERIMNTGLFRDVTMTIQERDPNNPEIRDLLVEVDESDTGSLNFGLAAGSDSGILGEISLTQRNFDIADFPESWQEYWQQKAFKGAGQDFKMAFQPGDKQFNYDISLTEPRFLDTDYSVGGGGGWGRFEYSDYTQETLYSHISVGRRFGDIWLGGVSLSAKRIELTDFGDDVPVEIFNDRGPSTINAITAYATRTTLEPHIRPTEGSRLSFSLSQYGLPSGDYTFTKTFVDYTTYFAIDRDFLDRVSTLRLTGKVGYIFSGTSPTFERFYLGGRSLRGFEFRTVSPKGTPRTANGNPDIPIGGDWEMYLGAQYEFPVVDKFISMVVFCDSGTVLDSPGFDDYRVSVGTGIRLHIPQLGRVPLAFDFGFPIAKLDTDKKKLFSFSVQLPF